MRDTQENLSTTLLLPCPFCGGEAESGMDDPGAPYPGGYFYVECRNENCVVSTENAEKGKFDDGPRILEELADRWNTRS